MNYSDLTNANLDRVNLLGIASYWSGSKPSPINLNKAVARGNNGVDFTNGWSFIGVSGSWMLINSNIPY